MLGNIDSSSAGLSVDGQSLKKSSAFGESGQILSQQESIGENHSEISDSELQGTLSLKLDVPKNEAGPQLRGINMEPKIVEIDPSKYSTVRLSETPYIFLLDIPSLCVSAENLDEVALVKAQNAKYKEVYCVCNNS